MKKKQLLFKMISLLCLIVLLAGCATTPANAPADAPAEAPAADDSAAAEPAAEEPAGEEPVTLTFLVGANQTDQIMNQALADAYMELHPNVTIEIEVGVPGTEGDNLVKTRLATGEMTDVFYYNSGSLMQALNPSQTLVDLSNEPFMANVADSFKPAVTADGGVYGVPVGTAAGGGILYNKQVFADNGLEVPQTWAEFQDVCETLKAAGIPPLIASFGDSWTAQLFVLADYGNVDAAVPGFAADYTANMAKYVDIPEAKAGFAHLQEGFEKDWWQPDYSTTLFDAALQMLADGDGAMYPMLSFAIDTIETNNPGAAENIGFFAVPAEDAETTSATLWMPLAIYIPKTTSNLEVAKSFVAFAASPEGADAITEQVKPVGPYVINGASLPDDVYPGVKDMQAYIDKGKAGPALEFVSPIKGPNLEQICVATGTGQMTADEAAENYDLDVVKQAQQLGLEGW